MSYDVELDLTPAQTCPTAAADKAERCIDRMFPFGDLPVDADGQMRLAAVYAQLATAEAVERQGQAVAELLDHIGSQLGDLVEAVGGVSQDIADHLHGLERLAESGPGPLGRLLARFWDAVARRHRWGLSPRP